MDQVRLCTDLPSEDNSSLQQSSIDLARNMHLLNNVPATSAQVLEDSELMDCLLARVRELRPDLDAENAAEALKYCLTIGYSVSSSQQGVHCKRSRQGRSLRSGDGTAT
jgi:hypothetical protein